MMLMMMMTTMMMMIAPYWSCCFVSLCTTECGCVLLDPKHRAPCMVMKIPHVFFT